MFIVIILRFWQVGLWCRVLVRYVNRANEATTKADAATALVDTQAAVTDWIAEKGLPTTTAGEHPTITSGKATITLEATEAACTYSAKSTTPAGKYFVDTKGDVTAFAYQDEKHFINWTIKNGWSKIDSAS